VNTAFFPPLDLIRQKLHFNAQLPEKVYTCFHLGLITVQFQQHVAPLLGGDAGA
jgi:hypothetical protein